MIGKLSQLLLGITSYNPAILLVSCLKISGIHYTATSFGWNTGKRVLSVWLV